MESPGQHLHPWFMKPHLFWLLLAFLFFMILGAAVFMGHSHLTDEIQKTVASNRSTVNPLALTIMERENAILGVLQSYANRRGVIAAAKDEDQSNAIRHLMNLVESNPGIDEAFITNPKDTLWVNFPVLEALPGKNLSDRDWYGGPGLYERVHHINPQMPFVLVSGYSEEINRKSFAQVLEIPLLPKPIDFQALGVRLRE